MGMVFCTLFDSYYLDKGLALCKSLNEVSADFKIYIFAFDQKAYEILCDLKVLNVIPVREEEILDDKLKKIKQERSRAEYCWTCSPIIIQYVLLHYNEKECTYIDADMFFYKSPQVLLDEIRLSKCNVSIIEHRFANRFMRYTNVKQHGRYCVEFNTFVNNEQGIKILEWWRDKCIKSCTMRLNEVGFGDQKYLDEWKNIFEGVHEIENKGAGVAPWNFADYKFIQTKGKSIELLYRKKDKCDLIFFHFQNLRFISDKKIDIGIYNEVGKFDKKLLDMLYDEYILILMEIRTMLKDKYLLEFPIYESRKGSSKWKYTGIRDLLAYIVSFINALVRAKMNIKYVSGKI